jgi:hypothetical protein
MLQVAEDPVRRLREEPRAAEQGSFRRHSPPWRRTGLGWRSRSLAAQALKVEP